MKIGILIKNFDELKNWEIRIIEEIKNSPTLELSLLIQDGRRDDNSTKSKVLKEIKSGNFLGKVAFKIQSTIEAKLFFKSEQSPNRENTISFLSSIPTIHLRPLRKGYLDVFSEKDSNRVKNHNLDIILRHEFGIIRGGILSASKYGIWSFHHGDNSINRGSPAGFWEIVARNPVIGVTLQQLTPELDGGLVIDKGFYNCHWSFVRNNNLIYEQSVSLLFKNIRRLERNELQTEKSLVYYNPLYKVPSLNVVFKYIFGFYSIVIGKAFSKLFAIRHDRWTLFVGTGNFFEAVLYRLEPVKLPKNEFWADPFLFSYKSEDFVLFENYSYKTKLGKISCGKLENGEITNVIDIFDFDCHLSYPFIFEEDNEIYLIPETSQKKRVEVYICVAFPAKWELYSTAFEGEAVVDTTYFRDESNQRWLFVNKGHGGYYNSELYIYRIDSLEFKEIESHKQNPVIVDSRVARNAGAIFEYDGKLVRPSQNSSRGIYGYGLNLNQIMKLNLDEYVEHTLVSVEPKFKKGLVSTHHLHQVNNKFIIDGAY